MAADTMVSDGDVKSRMTKILRIGDDLVGVAGEIPDIEAWLKWYRGGRRGKGPKLTTFAALVMRADGLAHFTGTQEMCVDQGFYAIGSGGKAALALLLAGHSCEEAVDYAVQVDANSSGPLQVETLKQLSLSAGCGDSSAVLASTEKGAITAAP